MAIDNDIEDKAPAASEVISRRGLMLIISSPSGAGKTTISWKLLSQEPNLTMSVSATTRAPRPEEVNGKDYFFIDPSRYHAMVAEGKFLEYAQVFGNLYGTPSEPVDVALAAGHDVLFDVDWQGAQQIAEKARDDLVSVFVLPPNHNELGRRLRERGEDSEGVIHSRMSKAASEMSHYIEYDYILVNSDIEKSVTAVQAILTAERLKRERQIDLHAFVARICGKE